MTITERYKKVLSDWKYLFEGFAPADDMSGGYVDQEDLDKMLKYPTKTQAIKCLESQIHYWLDTGPDPYMVTGDWENDKRVQEIRERY